MFRSLHRGLLVLALAGCAAPPSVEERTAQEPPVSVEEPAASPPDEKERPPNVLFLMTDQHHRESFGHATSRDLETPHLDRLAAEGVRIERTYVQSPQCVPSRMSLNTARYIQSHGTMWNGYPLRADLPTVAQPFKAAGYATAAFGKMHISRVWLKSHGWDTVDLDHAAYLRKHGFDKADIRKPAGWGQRAAPANNWWTGSSNVPADRSFAAWATESAEAFIRKHREQPFYLTVSYYGPHSPWMPPAPYDTLYDPAKIRLPPTRADDEADKPSLLARHITVGKQQPDGAQRNMIAKYYGLVGLIDHHIGRLLKLLDDLDLAEDTLVVMTSDHGEMLGEHHICGKGFYLYDANTATATLIRWPGRVRAGVRSDALVESIDIPATILDLVGLPALEGAQGESFKGILTGEKEKHRTFVHSAMRHPADRLGYVAMVADRDAKLMAYHADGQRGHLLFDLKKDPGELINVADVDSYAGTHARLQAEMDRWHEAMDFDPATHEVPPLGKKRLVEK